jgi:radical SAM protein with 4Fe4S-binding SPASM domain
MQLKATCAPHFYRIYHRRRKERAERSIPENPLHAMTRGCLGGSSFVFISHRGRVQPCGYLELDCGQLKDRPFEEIWRGSNIFLDLRDLRKYGGKCGRCEFVTVCGGCRARAYEKTGDYLAEEPLCVYQPRKGKGQKA